MDRGFFVTAADVVERSLAGPAGGADRLAVRFGSASVDVAGLSPSQLAVTRARLGAVEVELGDIELRVVRAAGEGFRDIDTRGWENTMALEHGEQDVVVVGRDFCARVRADGGGGLLACARDDDRFSAPLENTLRVVAAYRCLVRGGALLHSAGVVDGERARVFFGASGAGKSTLAAAWLARGRPVLSDELSAVFVDDGAAVVEQVPFAGDLPLQPHAGRRFPLAGLHRLGQGTARVEPMPRAFAVASLAACAPFVSVDPRQAPRLLANLEDLARRVPPTRVVVGLGDDPAELFAQGTAVTA